LHIPGDLHHDVVNLTRLIILATCFHTIPSRREQRQVIGSIGTGNRVPARLRIELLVCNIAIEIFPKMQSSFPRLRANAKKESATVDGAFGAGDYRIPLPPSYGHYVNRALVSNSAQRLSAGALSAPLDTSARLRSTLHSRAELRSPSATRWGMAR
jgi:hypothetical protein